MKPIHIFQALIVVLVWGVNFVVIRWGLNEVPPFLLATLRFICAFLPVAFFIRKPPPAVVMVDRLWFAQ